MTTQLEGRKLPSPATTQDEYAFAMVAELQRLNGNIETLTGLIRSALQPVEVAQGDEVKLQEPVKPKTSHRDMKAAD